MADDFYPFVDSGDPAPDNSHITGRRQAGDASAEDAPAEDTAPAAAPSASASGAADATVAYATRISIYDDMLSTPRVVVIDPAPVRTYLEEITNTVYRCMKEQGGQISLMVIREIVENFIHAHFVEPIISILDGGNTIRFADQGPGIEDKERAFEFGVTSANRGMKRYIRGTGAGFPMVQQYLEAAGGAVSIEDNLGAGTVITVSVDPARVEEIVRNSSRGAAVRASAYDTSRNQMPAAPYGAPAEYGQMPAQPQMAPGAGMPQGAPQPPMGNPGAWPPAAQQAYSWGAPWQQAPYGTMPPAYPVPDYRSPSFPQQPHGFSTYPGYPPQPAGTPYAAMPGQAAAPAQAAGPSITERGHLALQFLSERGQCGPTDLVAVYGQSGPTWSRELATLGKQGLVIKQGQKYHLTALGGTWLAEHAG